MIVYAPPQGPDPETLYLLDTSLLVLAATAYYLRCELLGAQSPTFQEEARRAVHLFALVHPHTPEEVPEDLRAIVQGAPIPRTRDLYTMEQRFGACFNLATRTGAKDAPGGTRFDWICRGSSIRPTRAK